MMDFRPTETPEGLPVLTTFTLRDEAYVVDYYGTLYCIVAHTDDPENWYWTEVTRL